MKLRQINENLIMQQIRGMMKSPHPGSPSLYFMRPQQHTSWLYNEMSGHDSGARVASGTQYGSGIPHKPRHRTYLGMEKRLGSIRL